MGFERLKRFLKPDVFQLYERADLHCRTVLGKAQSTTSGLLAKHNIPPSEVCFVAVGSLGRNEALRASDLDLIPVLRSDITSATFAPVDKEARRLLSEALKVKVSSGEDLTKFVTISALTDQDRIGGDTDTSSDLTKRMLILTESSSAGGGYPIGEVRREILQAYAKQSRTRGRHVLSLCNDIARYYRTLCIEYKAKIDVGSRDWCTRNVKLRHSRKMWYFSNMIAISAIADKNPRGDGSYIEELLAAFELSPCDRLNDALRKVGVRSTAGLFERFSFFLEYMEDDARRTALAAVEYEGRNNPEIGNPFLPLKLNSDLLHSEMKKILVSLPVSVREVVQDWFLF